MSIPSRNDYESIFGGGNLFDTSSLFNPYFGPSGDDTLRVDPFSPGGGGGGTAIPIQRTGCTNPVANNYDPLAKIDDGTCEFIPIESGPIFDDGKYNSPINVNISTKGASSAIILVDGSEFESKRTPNTIQFTEKELLTPKIISVTRSGYTTSESYRIYTKKFTSPLSNNSSLTPLTEQFEYAFYSVFVEQSINGKYIPIVIDGVTNLTIGQYPLRQRPSQIPLNFELSEINITPPPTPISEYNVRILPQLSSDDIIIYTNQKGQGGALQDGQPVEFKFVLEEGDNIPYIELKGNGISNNSHTVNYEFRNSSSNKVFSKSGLEARFELLPGNNDLEVNVVKIPFTPTPTNTPIISVNKTNISINKFDKDSKNIDYQIGYQTQNADYVIYTKGNEERQLPANGTLEVSPNEFEIGTSKIYLQPVSNVNGSGQYETITITTTGKSYLPGPDITHIDYPRVIKGKDFVEYNIDFNVNWQSINTNYVLVYAGNVSDSTQIGKFTNSGKVKFNVADVIRKSGQSLDDYRDVTKFKLFFIPYNSEGDAVTTGKTEEISITFDKGDLKIRRANLIDDIKSAFESELNEDGFKPLTSPFLTHYLHLGNADNKLIGTFGVDRETLSTKRINPDNGQEEIVEEEKSLVLKLYEPLPRNINTNDTVWISKVQSIPVIDKITITEDTTQECNRLTPNFDLDFYDDIGYQIYDELVASGSTTSTSVVNEFVSSSGFSLENLDLNFVTGSDYYWENFVKYSNAEERVENFYYKVKLIEAYEDKITLNENLSSGSLSPSTLKENERNQTKINNIKKEFDAFEKFLFTSSSYTTDGSDSITYPYSGSTRLHTTSSEVVNWVNGIIGNEYTPGSARHYDYNNLNSLRNNLPEHIKNDSNNSDYVLFFDMIGQHFDVVYTHAKGFAQSRKLEHKLDNGIKDSLVYQMLESLGWNTKSGQESQFLWEYAFGLDKDGTQVSKMSGRDRQEEIWRRLLNNLPYLYKHKGTKRAVHAALSTYGVPASMLTIMEFGGPKDPTLDGTVTYTFEDRTAAINIGGSAAITIPWKEYTSGSVTDFPNAVEIRVQTSERQDQRIISGDNWSLDVINTGTGSLAQIKLKVGENEEISDKIPFYNEEYKSIFINRISGSSNYSFDVYVKEGFQERIRNEVSFTLSSASIQDWGDGESTLIINPTGSFTGSIDEFRLWKDPLDVSLLDNHTLLPDAINGNHISSSTEDLLFRNDFEYPINVAVGTSTIPSGSIKNVSLLRDYALFATASNFENVTSYPYQYTPYERNVTAEVPQSGFNVSNKVRFEDQTLISNLNYKTRASRRSFDRAPLDSNRLGLFFSPIKEINMDILRSLGSFNIDNYIGDPSDEYSNEYRKLRDLRNYYFDRYTLNFQEYIQLVRYIDKSLFDVLESLVPARAKVSKGLLIEPHILERSKTEWNKPTGSNDSYETSIDTQENVIVSSTEDTHLALISASEDTTLIGETPFYSSSISAENITILSGSTSNYDGTISTEDVTTLNGSMTVNSGSDMGGISVTIDAELTASFISQYDSTQNYQQVGGFGKEHLSVAGFGLYGSGSHAIRTRIDKDGNKVKDRVKVYLLTEQYTELVPNSSGSIKSGSEDVYNEQVPPLLEEVIKYRTKVNILPFTGSDGNETSSSIGGNIVNVEELNGYFPTHYRYVGDLPTGLQNSYFNGSKQTSATTLDGTSPVITFTTNPNTLKVSDSGRGSGEPILEVD